jgi:hypothetical protein
VLRAYKPAGFVEQQHKARAAALAAGGTGAGQGPLRQLRLNRLLQEVQVGDLLVWTRLPLSAAPPWHVPARPPDACLPGRCPFGSHPAAYLPACPGAHLSVCLLIPPHVVLSCLPPLQVLRDCKHFIKLGSGERFGCVPQSVCCCAKRSAAAPASAATDAAPAAPDLLLPSVLLALGPSCCCRELPTPPGMLRMLCHLALDEPPEDESSNG